MELIRLGAHAKKTCFSLSHSATLQRKIGHSLNDQKIFYGYIRIQLPLKQEWEPFGILLDAFCFVLGAS